MREGLRHHSVMLAQLVAVCCAGIAALVALLIALQNRRWIERDREADRVERARSRQPEAHRSTVRRAAEQAFDLLPSDCIVWVKSIARSEPELAAGVSRCMREIESIRRWAYVLPLSWRLRIDCMASLLAHFGDTRAGVQLQRDIIDLLNGHEQPSRLQDDFARWWTLYLSLLLTTPRYQRDPATRDLAGQVREVFRLTGGDVADVAATAPTRQLLAGVTGRDEFISGRAIPQFVPSRG